MVGYRIDQVPLGNSVKILCNKQRSHPSQLIVCQKNIRQIAEESRFGIDLLCSVLALPSPLQALLRKPLSSLC
jgi:hypothetical protein